MAPKKTTESTAMIPWEQRFAVMATAGVAQVANIGANIHQIKFDRGFIKVDDAEIKSGKLECIIAGFVAHNRWNEKPWNPDDPQPPDCYAFSLILEDKTEETKPHAAAPKKQNEDCLTCVKNVYGSARVGDGKACANTARLGIFIGNDLKNAESVAKAEMYTGSVSPTNVKYLSAYLKQLETVHKRPIWAAVTEITSNSDPKTQIKLEFKMVSLLKDAKIIEALYERIKPEPLPSLASAITETLIKPYSASVDKKAGAKNSKNQKFAAKKAVRR